MWVVEGMYEKCAIEECNLFVSIARHIWRRRNAFIHEGTFLHPNIIVEQAQQETELLKARMDGEKKKQEPSGDPSSTSW